MKLYIIVEEVKNHEPTLIQNFEKKYFIDQLQFLTAPVQFFLKKTEYNFGLLKYAFTCCSIDK